MAKRGPTEQVKTSIKLPKDLWKKAHHRAVDDGVDLQDVIARALASYLKERRTQ